MKLFKAIARFGARSIQAISRSSVAVAAFCVAMVFAVLPQSAHAAVDTAISGPVDDLTSFWTGKVQVLILLVVVFMIGIAYLKKVKR